MIVETYILIALILVNFVLMTRGYWSPEVGMPMTALCAMGLVILADVSEGLRVLEQGFAQFAPISILFTAIAVPSHLLARSHVLDKMGMGIGAWAGHFSRIFGIDTVLLVVSLSLTMTYLMAGTLHNTTSILISAAIVTVICESYNIPAVPVLSGSLIASNLGGFSTRWGDTPNIVEAQVWGLKHKDFFTEILPVNLGLLILLILATWLLTKYQMRNNETPELSTFQQVARTIEFIDRRENIIVNKKLLRLGLVGILVAVIGPLLFSEYELFLSGLAIIICVVGDQPDHRRETLFALGLNTYGTLLSIFVLSQVMANSPIGIGDQLTRLLIVSEANLPSIVLASYFGTLFTEAASWATVAAPLVYTANQSNLAAWSLGAGICAGSSSLITAATAGVILLNETAENSPQNRMTFGKYFLNGLVFSLIMLAYYIVVLSLMI